MDELQGTYATLLDTQDVLVAVQQENSALKQRCSEFVRANLDHMLAWRSLKAKADALDGEQISRGPGASDSGLRGQLSCVPVQCVQTDINGVVCPMQ